MHRYTHVLRSVTLLLCTALCSVALAQTPTQQNAPEEQVTTAMNKVTTLLKLKACQKPLNDLAADLIGTKEHRLLSYSKEGDSELFNAVMVLEYHDRVAHVNFSAVASASGECDAQYTSTFFVNVPCALAREEVIKRFVFVGRLTSNTQLFKHKRKPYLNAMISPTNRGKGCLVTHKTQ